MTELTIEYPLWYVALCLLLGAGYSYLLYRKNRLPQDLGAWVVPVLAVLRFALVSFLAFLLLSPLLKSISREIEKPILIFAQDNSESVKSTTDSVTLHQHFHTGRSQFIEAVSKDFDVRTYTFGKEVFKGLKSNFDQKTTDVGLLFDEIETKFSNRNIGALILASDGMYNKGVNPLYKASKFEYPIYTVALGDTTEKKDITIAKVSHNKIAFKGNQFPFRILLNGKKYKGEKVAISITSKGSQVFSKEVLIDADDFSISIPALLEAKAVGVQKYQVVVTHLEGEASYENNEYEVYIDVLDGKQKILLVSDAPHPDIAAIKSAISSKDNYEIEAKLVKDFNGEISEYSLVIINQLSKNVQGVVATLKNAGIPTLYILNTQSNISFFNKLELGLNITGGGRNQSNDVEGVFNNDFSLFTLNKEHQKLVKQFPPLQVPFGDYQLAGGAEVLVKQKIGLVETEQPLIYFNKEVDRKFGVIIGEGVWKWRLANYSIAQNHEVFNTLFEKIIQYLSIKENKKQFRIDYVNKISEGEPIIIEAQLYNNSLEKINTPDATIEVIDEEENSYNFTFGRTDDEYKLDLGSLPVGKYTFKAITNLNSKIIEEYGEFTVHSVQLEALRLKADHQLLYKLSKNTNGELIYPNELKELSKKLQLRDDIVPISYSKEQFEDLINIEWIFFVLLGLLSTEWFIRKRNGSY